MENLILVLQFFAVVALAALCLASYVHVKSATKFAHSLVDSNTEILKGVAKVEEELEKLRQKIDVAELIVEAKKS